MVRFIVTTAVIATVGSAYLGNLSNMAQPVLNSGKKVFENHARTITSLSQEGENSPAFETMQGNRTQVVFASAPAHNPYQAAVAVTPAPQYRQNATSVTIQENRSRQTEQNPDAALYGSGPIEVDKAVMVDENASENEKTVE